ncbi:DUF1015 domain-containing protein [Streptomyces sp. C11-1]|uniref:DUF1015 domain-containing protein n=1 Tax=Streptomyces durocortorensis TaxID=2811104 RepID=A0ABY9W239_9ACTN|nr:DUF1015 domain-containing protein [Streptomyces durocortorensis]WNF30093.1 DUF1015 domain-containing protein [Streptomyces durocortorensis]
MTTVPSRKAHTTVRLHPFRAVRYDPARAGQLSAVLSAPYDDMSPAHARAQRARPHHIARLLFAADPQDAAGQMERWLERGVLRRDAAPSLYVYEQRLGPRLLQRGLIGELTVAGPHTCPVVPHEDVQEHVVRQRAAHMSGLGAQLEPLLLTHRSAEGTGLRLAEWVAEHPRVASAQLGGVTHHLWRCTDPDDQALLTSALGGPRVPLVADGHHRLAAARRLTRSRDGVPWQHSQALLVDSASTPLRLRAIHRVLPGLDAEKAARAASGVARVRPLPSGPRLPRPDELVLVGDGRAWSVTEPHVSALSDALAGLPIEWRAQPAAVTDCLLIPVCWSIPDLPGSVVHLHDADRAVAAVTSQGTGTAVLLPAPTEHRVRELAEQGVLLPRKSTSFGPKPAAGLVMRVLRNT